MDNSKLMPDFLIIGAGKSGTTSLNNYLSQHPDIFMSPVKEPNFFAYINTDVTDLGNLETIRHFEESIRNLDDYLHLFADAGESQMKGEVSNTYMTRRDSATYIKEYIPHVKIIAILRNPVERLYSRYLHLARDNRLAEIDPIEEGLKNESSVWWKRNDLIQEGFYHENLKPYFELFIPEQIKILFYEEFKRSDDNFFSHVFTFLEVDNNFKPVTDAKLNRSGFVKNKTYHKLFGEESILLNFVKKNSPAVYEKLSDNQKLKTLVSKVRSRNLHRPAMSVDVRKQLISIYEEDIVLLQQMLNRDLSEWLK